VYVEFYSYICNMIFTVENSVVIIESNWEYSIASGASNSNGGGDGSGYGYASGNKFGFGYGEYCGNGNDYNDFNYDF
jgi:hypothetical protein